MKYNSKAELNLVNKVFVHYFYQDADYTLADKRRMFDILSLLCLNYLIKTGGRYE